ncbi:hypothetical protein [Thermasporomyces composti]|jgi:hypothetical protein|uniref:Uncharacterized protein n=1 Tax=Thermasporomyces composti TaxID=696763 RepID=A0A3D9V4W2_THECX|nr:hypothetical protein [Thermasporomyces composti]REF36788.1 hypothetical protein DFJ64_2217 [Thermasporomyces composti]
MAEESRTTVAVAAYLLTGCRRATELARTATGDPDSLVGSVRELSAGDGRGGLPSVVDRLSATDESGPAHGGDVLVDLGVPTFGALCDDVDLGPDQMLGTIAWRLGCEAASPHAVHAASD